ncbi:hypothetical protein CRI94_06995 [Longibacter salinarum]|uniref:Secretion system C-terminal sorting domain-containing protein n=1 Tax=Longibacter salinarum TaxID=1850348 RepID=A0A2A8CZI1_9BACT|nr:Ig-like domain-containing protein [Longibacter salinarum]PEN13808.1 hypothetical protein CRI94_06995 [Longibacter salinarum]
MPEPLLYRSIPRYIGLILGCITLWMTASPTFAQNAAPVGLDDDYVVEMGETLSIDAPGVLSNDYDPNGDALSVVSFSDPGDGTVSISTDGSFSYTPDGGFSGTDSFSYTIRDAAGTLASTTTVTITVQPDADREAVAIDDHYVTMKGETLTVSSPGVLENDYDPDGDDIIAASFFQPANGTVSLTTGGEFTYTPDSGFSGTDSFTYNMRDENGGTVSTGTVTLYVKPPANRPPVTLDDAYTVVEGQTLNVSAPAVLANDYDPDDDDIIASSYISPSNGSLSLNTAGEFTYTPDPGFTGTDSFKYSARDANGATSASSGRVEITVIPASQTQPLAGDDLYRTKMDSTLTVAAPGLLGNDLAPNSSSRIVASYFNPPNGSVSVVTNGEFAYTPDAGFTGSDSFTYTLRDGNGNTDTGTVTITVYNPNRPPEAHDDTFLAIEGQQTTIPAPGVLQNDYDPDGDAITARSFFQPANGSLSLTVAGEATYTSDAGFTGSDSFTYTMADENDSPTSTATVTFEVQPDPNRRPVGATDRYSVFEGRTLDIAAPGLLANDYDADGDGDDIIATSYSSPSNGSLSLNTAGAITYTPNAGFTGTDSFTYSIQDSQGNYAASSTTVEIVVADDAVLPVELANLEASSDEDRVVLTWTTLSEKNNDRFEIQRKVGDDGPFKRIGAVQGAGTTSEAQEYRFSDELPFTAETASYRLKQIDVDGTSTLSDPIEVSRGTPSDLKLLGAAPHPVHTQAEVVYTLPKATDIRLEVFDMLGRRVATLVNGRETAGRKTYSMSSRGISSGTYLLVLTADGERKTQRLTIVR